MPVRGLGQLPWLALFLSMTRPALALDAGDARAQAQASLGRIEAQAASATPAYRILVKPPSAAERIAGGEMLLRSGDAPRAIAQLSKVLELYRQGKTTEAAYADASFLVGEAYFQTKEYLSSRRHHAEILDKAARPPFRTYVGRAASRLVDVALRTGDPESLSATLDKLASLSGSDRSGAIAYARAKGLLAQRNYGEARRALSGLPASSPYALRGEYLLGVILLREAVGNADLAPEGGKPEPAPEASRQAALTTRYQAAIDQFQKLARRSARTDPDRHVVDLAWMAVGRLHYGAGRHREASRAYSHVDRHSPEFATMLQELAWVKVRLGDYIGAQRALEVLAVMDPQNSEAADVSLLRGDLMLRAGQFDRALSLYRSVHNKLDPIREQVDRFLSFTDDPAVYFDRLTASQDLPPDEQLPRLALDWAREEAQDDQVFGAIDDLSRSHVLIDEAHKLAARLRAVLLVPTRVKAFPELRAQMQWALRLINQAALVRVTLARGMDDAASSSAGGELGSVRAERRTLMRRLRWLPIQDEDFARRDEVGERQWDRVAQHLHEVMLEIDRLNAKINGLKRLVREADRHGVELDPAGRQRFEAEIQTHEAELSSYRKQVAAYRDDVDNGRAQIGFGDQRYADDEATRRRFREVFSREVVLSLGGQDSGSAAAYARDIQPLVARVGAVEARLETQLSNLDRKATEAADGLRQKIDAEVALLDRDEEGLAGLDQESRLLIGSMARDNFVRVRDRLKDIVLRADVGIVQHAWEVREEQRVRVRNLQRERAREDQDLNDELREVLEDAEEH